MALFSLLLLARVAPARADASEPPEYRQVVEEAVDEFEAGRFQESRALFTRAHQLFPNARTLRGLGMTEFELRNYAESIHDLEEALSSKVRTLEGPLREETERLLRRARAFVSRVMLELEPRHARVIVDGMVVRVGPGQALLLTVGEHVLEIQADGYAPERRVLSVKSSGDETLRFELRLTGGVPTAPPAAPAPTHAAGPVMLPPPAWQTGANARPTALAQPVSTPAASQTPVARPDSAASPPGERAARAHSKTGAWVLTGVSGAALVGGVVMLVLGFQDIAAVEDAADGSRWSEVEAANGRAPGLTGAGFAVSAVGAVGLVGGLVWALRKPKADKSARAAALRLPHWAWGRF
jgi:hypothetical protein